MITFAKTASDGGVVAREEVDELVSQACPTKEYGGKRIIKSSSSAPFFLMRWSVFPVATNIFFPA